MVNEMSVGKSLTLLLLLWANVGSLAARAQAYLNQWPLVHPNVSALAATRTGGVCTAGTFLQPWDADAPVPWPAWDAVLDCYDSNGHLQFSLEGVNSRDAFASDVVIGSDGTVYLSGSFDTDLYMGGQSLEADTFDTGESLSPGHGFVPANPFFVASIDPDGTLRWLRKPLASDYESAIWQLEADDSGIVAAGFSHGTVHLTETVTVPPDHVFLARYDPDGSVIWGMSVARFFSATDPVQPLGLAPDSGGGLWILLHATDSTLVLGEPRASGTHFDGMALLHVGADGSLLHKRVLNADPRGGAAMAVGQEGEIYVTGSYVDSLWLDDQTLLLPASKGGRTRVPPRFFLARYESDGRLAWSTHTKDEKWSVVFSEGVDLAVGVEGNVYVGIVFRGEMVLDGDTLSSVGRTSLHVAAYSPEAERRFGFSLGATSDEPPAFVSMNAEGMLFVVFDGTAYRYDRAELLRADAPVQLPDAVEIEHYPDPATDILYANMTLRSSSHVQLIVYDLLGRAVMHVLDKSFGSGVHGITIPLSDLPSGRYFYRLNSSVQSAVGSFVVNR